MYYKKYLNEKSFCPLIIICDKSAIHKILFETPHSKSIGKFEISKEWQPAPSNLEIIKTAEKQLDEYFSGKRTSFNLKISPQGTEFQKSVWKALQTIPYGKTATYKDVAEKISNPKASRAVGNANNKNPIPIIIPCHRVIGADGSLTGFAGGLKLKTQLLNLEQK